MEPRRYEAAEFEAVLGTTFVATVDAAEVPLELVVVDVKEGPRIDNAFSIEFAGPPDPFLPQRIYSLRHDRLGQMEVFLVPVAGDERGGFTYEAVFTSLET